MKNVLITLLCLFLLDTVKAQNSLTNIQKLTGDGEHYSKPQWSPDGSKLMFTTEHNRGVYVMSLDQRKVTMVTNLPFVGYNASWHSDGKSIIIQEKKRSDMDNSSYFQTKRLEIATGKLLSTDKIAEKQIVFGKRSVSNGRATSVQPVEVYINADLQLVAMQDGKESRITNDDGQYYNPLISPDGTKVAVHKGSNVYVFSLINPAEPPVDLGAGLASGWTPDSRSLVSFMDESTDGHTVSNSELHQVFISGKKNRVQLTRTANVIEMWPSISPDGKRIAFSDEKSGDIFIADLTN
jgi:Tol biopolymer transport system component